MAHCSVSNYYPLYEDDDSEESKAADLLLAQKRRAAIQPAFKDDTSPLHDQIAKAYGDPKQVAASVGDSGDHCDPRIPYFILDDPHEVIRGGYASVILFYKNGTPWIKVFPQHLNIEPPKREDVIIKHRSAIQ